MCDVQVLRSTGAEEWQAMKAQAELEEFKAKEREFAQKARFASPQRTPTKPSPPTSGREMRDMDALEREAVSLRSPCDVPT